MSRITAVGIRFDSNKGCFWFRPTRRPASVCIPTISAVSTAANDSSSVITEVARGAEFSQAIVGFCIGEVVFCWARVILDFPTSIVIVEWMAEGAVCRCRSDTYFQFRMMVLEWNRHWLAGSGEPEPVAESGKPPLSTEGQRRSTVTTSGHRTPACRNLLMIC